MNEDRVWSWSFTGDTIGSKFAVALSESMMNPAELPDIERFVELFLRTVRRKAAEKKPVEVPGEAT